MTGALMKRGNLDTDTHMLQGERHVKIKADSGFASISQGIPKVANNHMGYANSCSLRQKSSLCGVGPRKTPSQNTMSLSCLIPHTTN